MCPPFFSAPQHSRPPAAPPPSAPSRPSSGGALRPAAVSFSAVGDARDLSRVMEQARSAVGAPAGLFLFATGAAAEDPEALLTTARSVIGPIPAVFAAGSGVRTEEGEHEGCSAVVGLLWRRGRSHSIGIGRDAPSDSVGSTLAEQVRALGRHRKAIALFGQASCLAPNVLTSLSRELAPATILGAGTSTTAWRMTREGQIEPGAVCGLVLEGGPAPTVRSSCACKLITPLARITAAQGPLVLTIDGRPALSVLSDGARALSGQPLVLTVLAEHSAEDTEGRAPELLVRGIRGVDPARRAIVVSEEAQPGMLIAFGILDATAARLHLGRTLRDLNRNLAGGAPEFGLMLSCARRGTGFYSSASPEAGLFRDSFLRVPMAGLLAPAEVAPFGTAATVQLYSAVIAMFAAPS